MASATPEIEALEQEILDKKKELAALRRANREPVSDYMLETAQGPTPLSSFFGDKDELVVIHNMGRGCNHCSLWADGLTGFTKHIQARAGFVLVSADSAERVLETAQRRGWNFPVASNAGSGFERDMGFTDQDGSPWPGISAFRREDEKIYRHGYANLGEGDDFCPIWHIWALFPKGWDNWAPK
jgi:predicted dithiol-disulfide oxidoreductase (DUF899 family)